jgi:hypothetical protein
MVRHEAGIPLFLKRLFDVRCCIQTFFQVGMLNNRRINHGLGEDGSTRDFDPKHDVGNLTDRFGVNLKCFHTIRPLHLVHAGSECYFLVLT